MLQRLLSIMLLIISTQSMAAAPNPNTPEGYNTICSYGNTCMLSKTNLVAFGNQGQYVYKVLNGSFACNEKTFNKPTLDAALATCSIKSIPHTASPIKALNKHQNMNIADGSYAIVSRHSGKALTLNENNKLQQTLFDGKTNHNQYFELKKNKDGYFTLKVVSRKTTTYLTVKNWQTSDGTELILSERSNSWNQEWQLNHTTEGYFTIVSRFNNKALDILGLNTHNNAKLQLWTYWGGNNQQWQLIPLKTTNDTKNHFEF